MTSLINKDRPPVFCPGCSHEQVVSALDTSFQNQGLIGSDIAIVTDIGCSGLFDTFFNTHALHGLHGRALTYATGLKLACPNLTVVVIMGDGGLGIGAAHVLSSCRRNLNLTLLVLNNFNYGMTGGQYSATTPVEAQTSSDFLGQLEAPLDICTVCASAGATWIDRVSARDPNLSSRISQALSNNGFSMIDITGICPGRFSKRNKQPARLISDASKSFAAGTNPNPGRSGQEYGQNYRQRSRQLPEPIPPKPLIARLKPTISTPLSILFLGAAGQRVNTAAEILCLAGIHAGLQATLKSDYPITVLRGHSVSEVMLSPEPIAYTASDAPDIIFALAAEGVARRYEQIRKADSTCMILQHTGIEIPETAARIYTFDLNQKRLKPHQWAVAFLSLLTHHHPLLNQRLLSRGLADKFSGERLKQAAEILDLAAAIEPVSASMDK
jgi:2-oxoglutarate ferredoxin oxidoreductase subunit beta